MVMKLRRWDMEARVVFLLSRNAERRKVRKADGRRVVLRML